MKCAICRDLLPLYLDALTSAETNDAVCAHLENCAECAQYCRNLRENPQGTQDSAAPLHAVRKKSRRLIAGIMLGTAAVIFAGIFLFCVYGIVPLHSDRLHIWANLYAKDGAPRISLTFSGDCTEWRNTVSGDWRETDSGRIEIRDITFYPTLFALKVSRTHCHTMTMDLPYVPEDTITVHCLDGDFTYTLDELLNGEGFQ